MRIFVKEGVGKILKNNNKCKKVLIVGGAGFIGSHLVDLCLSKGFLTAVYDDFSTGKKHFLKNLDSKYIIEGNILDYEKLGKFINEYEPEIVFHLAAIHHIPTCENNPRKALNVNIDGTASVFEASGSKASKIVFASTGALYDPSNQDILNEQSPLKPTDIYSISKMACENIAEYFSKKLGISVVSARLFNTVGRRETNRHLIPDILEQLAKGKREVRLGNLTPLRDYIHVEDVAEALYSLGEKDFQNKFEVFNVGTGIEYSVVDLVNIFSEVIGEEIKIQSVPELQRKIDRPTQKSDSTKLISLTNWKPKRSLRQALEEVWKEHLSHQ